MAKTLKTHYRVKYIPEWNISVSQKIKRSIELSIFETLDRSVNNQKEY